MADDEHPLVGARPQQLAGVARGEALAQRLPEHRLDAERLAGQLGGPQRADLRAGVDGVEDEVEGGQRAAGDAGLLLPARRELAGGVVAVVRLGLAVSQEPELGGHRRTA